jgi:hypothetical protein
MTRPVCLFGENAVYKGHGDTNDEAETNPFD